MTWPAASRRPLRRRAAAASDVIVTSPGRAVTGTSRRRSESPGRAVTVAVTAGGPCPAGADGPTSGPRVTVVTPVTAELTELRVRVRPGALAAVTVATCHHRDHPPPRGPSYPASVTQWPGRTRAAAASDGEITDDAGLRLGPGRAGAPGIIIMMSR